MILERTHDMTAVNAIARHPLVWPALCDDLTQDTTLPDLPDLTYLGVYNPDLIGFFMLKMQNGICAEVHTCLHPDAWGKIALQAGRALLRFVFDCGIMKLVSSVPSNNSKALRFALSLGLKQEGVNRQSFLKDGVLLDQIMVGITREEYKCL
jgi:RimJ/RimL family protein N-acetyltransferase